MFVVIGVAFAWASLRYELGTLLAMGPGYVPLLAGTLLAALGIAVVVKAYVAPDTVAADPEHREEADVGAAVSFRTIQWRPIVLLSAAVVFFGLTVDGLGLLPATFGTSLLAALARKETSVIRAVLVAAGLTAACYVIFVLLLQLRLGLLGDWLGA